MTRHTLVAIRNLWKEVGFALSRSRANPMQRIGKRFMRRRDPNASPAHQSATAEQKKI